MKQALKSLYRPAKRTGLLICVVSVLFSPTLLQTAYAQFIPKELQSVLDGHPYFVPDEDIAANCDLTGSASETLSKQQGLDPQWIHLIVNEASQAGADPLAMATVLYWENRKFPEYARHTAGSDAIGRGPWQIIAATWAGHMGVLPSDQRAYNDNVEYPVPSTRVAASIVSSYGGVAGVPIGSIGQDFGRSGDGPINTPSIATFAKNYNAGQATWRQPGEAGHLQSGRTWMNGTNGAWFADKQKIIDDYIVAATLIYYKLAIGEQLPTGANTDQFVQEGLARQAEIERFSYTGECGAINGDIVATALNLAWDTRYPIGDPRYHGFACRESKPEFATVGSDGNPNGGALFQFNKQSWHSNPCSDCGVFVSTVMRASGADPNYPQRGTSIQLPYLEQKAAEGMYQRIDLPANGDTSLLQPGDILITISGSGHTQLFVGPQVSPENNAYKNYNVASASWNDRVPQPGNHYQGFGQFFVAFRWLGGAGGGALGGLNTPE